MERRGERPSRRAFVRDALAGAGAASAALLVACGRLPFQAQQPARIPRIGYLGSASAGSASDEAFVEGLRDLGYAEGQTINIDWRFADGQAERVPQLVAELIAIPVDLILTSGPSATVGAQRATTTLPLVMCFGGEPVELGLIASFARPGGNLTGLAALTSELGAKRLELLAAALPDVSRVAVLWDATAGPTDRARMESAARALALHLQALEVRRAEELEGAFEAALSEGAGAVFVAWDPTSIFNAARRRIADLAARSRLPVCGGSRDFAEAGALLTYGANFPSMYRRAASHVDKILKGAKPADIPVEQPMTFELVVNMTTARALGITLSNEIMLQATEVIR